MILLKCCTQYVIRFGKPRSSHRTGKVQFSSQFQRRAVVKNVSNCLTIALTSMLVWLLSKSFKLGVSNTWIGNFQMFKLYLEKAEEPEIKLSTFVGSSKKERVPEKHLFLLYWLCQSLWLCGSQQTVENSSRDGNTRLPDLPLETCMQVRKQQLELDMKQQTGSK